MGTDPKAEFLAQMSLHKELIETSKKLIENSKNLIKESQRLIRIDVDEGNNHNTGAPISSELNHSFSSTSQILT